MDPMSNPQVAQMIQALMAQNQGTSPNMAPQPGMDQMNSSMNQQMPGLGPVGAPGYAAMMGGPPPMTPPPAPMPGY